MACLLLNKPDMKPALSKRMKPRTELLLFIFISVFFTSCREKNQSIYYKLIPSTFSDELIIEGTVEAVNSATIACPSRINGTIKYIVEEGAYVHKGDTVCILENSELSNNYENLLANVEKSKAQYEKSKADLKMSYAVLKAQVENNNAQTQITNLDSAQLSYLSPQQRKIKELELEKAAIEKAKYEKKLEYLEKINKSELEKLKLQIDRTQFRADRIKERLDNMVLISPQDGLVLRGIAWATGNKVQEGDQGWSGMPVATIPDMTEMKVVIQAPESEYKRIKENDQVLYTFDAMPGNRAWGKILKRAPMGKPINNKSKVKYFEITATVDSFKVIPDLGISANCKVMLAEVTDTVVVPQLAIFDEDSISVVYVKHGHHFEKREVLLGESSPKEAVIIAGLNGDETVSFEKPLSSKIKSTILLPDSLKLNKSPEMTNQNEMRKPPMPVIMKVPN